MASLLFNAHRNPKRSQPQGPMEFFESKEPDRREMSDEEMLQGMMLFAKRRPGRAN